jgi:hypothetical protein
MTDLPPESRRTGRIRDALPWIIVAALAVLYFLTRAPAAYPGDPVELVTAAVTLGVSHPTGYPLYLLLGKAATLIVFFASETTVVNGLSAVYLVVMLVVLVVVQRRLGVSPVVIAASLALLGTTPSLWNAATVAEVYTLHGLLLAVLLLLVQRPGPGTLRAAFLVAGLALGNHMMSVLVVPGLLVWLAWLWLRDRVPRTTASLLWPAGCYLGGASVVLLLFVFDRPGAINYIDQYAFEFPDPLFTDPLKRIVWLLSGSQYGATSGVFGSLTSGEIIGGLANVFRQLAADNATLFLVGLLGITVVWLRRSPSDPGRPIIAVLAVITASSLLFLATYTTHFERVFFVHGYVGCAVGLALLVERHVPGARARALLGVCLILIAAGTAVAKFGSIDKSGTEFYERETAIFLRVVEHDAVLFSSWRNSTLLWHAQWVGGINPSVTIVNARPDHWPRLAAGFRERPLYFESVPPGATEQIFVPAMHFYRLTPKAPDRP